VKFDFFFRAEKVFRLTPLLWGIEQVSDAYPPLFVNTLMRVAPYLSQENWPCREFPKKILTHKMFWGCPPFWAIFDHSKGKHLKNVASYRLFVAWIKFLYSIILRNFFQLKYTPFFQGLCSYSRI
jgi:hypothetical protein